MTKLHTRYLRKLRMQGVKGRSRKTRPKTFTSQESAKKYAESKGIKKYKLVDILELDPKRNKIKVVVE